MNFLINRIFFSKSEAALKYTILKNKFLVPVTPKRALSGYILFSNEKRPSLTGSMTEISAQIGEEWKKMTLQQKTPYLQKAKQMSLQQKKVIAQYQEKYLAPFKTISISSLLVKKQLGNQKGLKIQEAGQKIKEAFAKLTQEDRKKLHQEVDKIKSEREKYTKEFLIPEAEFKSERSFMMQNLKKKGKTLGEASDEVRLRLRNKYAAYIQEVQKTREQFAQKHGITMAELNEIISLNNRKLRRENEDVTDKTLNQLLPPAPIIKKRSKKTHSITSSPAKKRTVKKNSKQDQSQSQQ